MNIPFGRVMASVLVVLAAMLVLASPVSANNYWYCTGSTPYRFTDYYIKWYNAASGDYWSILNEEAKTEWNAWSPYTDVYLAPVSSYSTSDQISAYSGFYGSTGWTGLATIWASGCKISYARVRLNRSYLDSSSYTRTNKKHVACQEVGHTLGLGHSLSSTSCMGPNYSTASPSTHDRDLVNAIY